VRACTRRLTCPLSPNANNRQGALACRGTIQYCLENFACARGIVTWRFDSILGWNRRWGARTNLFDSTLGYPGESPHDWQGDDLPIMADQTDALTSFAFLNADGLSVCERRHEELRYAQWP
jgi:hypothetical protein